MKSMFQRRPLWTSIMAIMLAFLVAVSSFVLPEATAASLAKYTTTLSVGSVNVSVEAAHSVLVSGPKLNSAINYGNLTSCDTGRYGGDTVTSVEFKTVKKFSDFSTSGYNTNYVDVSEKQDGSIRLYRSTDGKTVKIISERTIAANSDFSYVFQYMTALKTVTFTKDFDTTRTTSLAYLFRGCGTALSRIDNLGSFDTSGVTTMQSMFNLCSGGTIKPSNTSLKTLDVAHFDTSNVTDMGSMFRDCAGLTSLDLSGYKTSRVTDMGGMFDGCSGLVTLNLRNFSSESLKTTMFMFRDCSNLTTIYASYDFDCRTGESKNKVTANGKDSIVDNMFEGCTKLVGGSGTSYADKINEQNTSNPDHYSDNTYAVVDIRSSNGDQLVYQSTYGYFTHFSSSLSNAAMLVNPSTNSGYLVSKCPDAEHVIFGKLSAYSSAVNGVDGVDISFDGNGSVKLYYVSSTKTAYILSDKTIYFNVSANYFFTSMASLKSVRFGNVSTESVATFQSFFDGCKSLNSITFDSDAVFDTSSSGDFGGFIRDCKSLKMDVVNNLLSRMSFVNALDLGGFFDGCTSLEGVLDLSDKAAPKNTTLQQMFRNCSGLTSINISSFTSAKIVKSDDAFSGCTNLTAIYTSADFDISKNALTYKGSEFNNCPKLKATYGNKTFSYNASRVNYNYAKPYTDKQDGYFTINALTQQLSLFSLAPLMLASFNVSATDAPAVVADITDKNTAETVSATDAPEAVVSPTDTTTTVTTTATTTATETTTTAVTADTTTGTSKTTAATTKATTTAATGTTVTTVETTTGSTTDDTSAQSSTSTTVTTSADTTTAGTTGTAADTTTASTAGSTSTDSTSQETEGPAATTSAAAESSTAASATTTAASAAVATTTAATTAVTTTAATAATTAVTTTTTATTTAVTTTTTKATTATTTTATTTAATTTAPVA